jgi:hypothetical protein
VILQHLGISGGAAGGAWSEPAPAQPAATAAVPSLATPGLRNEIGEYNCFLNVIIQCLWRCAEFRQQVGKTWWAKCLYRH